MICFLTYYALKPTLSFHKLSLFNGFALQKILNMKAEAQIATVYGGVQKAIWTFIMSSFSVAARPHLWFSAGQTFTTAAGDAIINRQRS